MTKVDLEKFFVGFDNLMNNPLHVQFAEYPRYNIEKVEGGYQIQVALPGWKKEQISVDVHKNTLTIKGEKDQDPTEREWIHKGISGKSFQKQLKLDDSLEVSNAVLEDGMLYIDLFYCASSKPKSIPIG